MGYSDRNFRVQNFKLDFLEIWKFFALNINILLRTSRRIK